MSNIMIQGSEAWRLHRKNCITATDVAKILNISPYETAYQCWSRKLGLIPDIEENEAMRRGSQLESVALRLFIEESAIKMTPKVIFYDFDRWKMASLDGISECGRYAVEIKCSQKIYDKAKQGIIDDIYKCQMNWQMYVLGIRRMYFAAYWDGEIIIIEFERDDDFLNEIMPKIHEFYSQMMDFVAPPLTQKDYVKREDRAWDIVAENLRYKLKQFEPYEKLKDEVEALKQELIKMSNGQSSIGGGLRLTKCTRKNSVQYDKIPEILSLDKDYIESFRKKPSEYYRISENE